MKVAAAAVAAEQSAYKFVLIKLTSPFIFRNHFTSVFKFRHIFGELLAVGKLALKVALFANIMVFMFCAPSTCSVGGLSLHIMKTDASLWPALLTRLFEAVKPTSKLPRLQFLHTVQPRFVNTFAPR